MWGESRRRSNTESSSADAQRTSSACRVVQAVTSQCRAYVAAVVIWLAGQNAKQAYLCYQVALDPTPERECLSLPLS